MGVVDALPVRPDEAGVASGYAHDEAVAELHRWAGTHFDPTVAEALARFAKPTADATAAPTDLLGRFKTLWKRIQNWIG